MKMRSIFSSLLAMALLIGLTTSCEDEFQTQQDGVKSFKTVNTEGQFVLTHPDAINQGEDFTISFENECAQPILQLWNGEGWDILQTGECGQTSFTVMMEDYGVYSFMVTLQLGECICEFGDPVNSDIIDIVVCRVETAFAVDLGEEVWDGKKAWWYVFDVSAYDPLAEIPVPVVGEIWADQDVMIGTIVFDGSTLEIELADFWILNHPQCVETVKVQGYETLGDLPNKRPTAGKMDLRGDLLSVDLTDYVYDYYVVHLDVKTCDVPDFTFVLVD